MLSDLCNTINETKNYNFTMWYLGKMDIGTINGYCERGFLSSIEVAYIVLRY